LNTTASALHQNEATTDGLSIYKAQFLMVGMNGATFPGPD